MSAPAAVSASSTARCVDVPNGPSIPFTWDTSGQHTLTWTQPIRMRIRGTTSTLGAGSCNLYTYPSVRLLRGTTVRPDVLEGPRLEVLEILSDGETVVIDRTTELELLRDGPFLRSLNLGGNHPQRVGEYMFNF